MTRIAIVIAVASLMIAACGKRGELEEPPAPLFGPGSSAAAR